MSSRRPFLRRLAGLVLALLAVTSLCRSRGVDQDLPLGHCIQGLLFPVPPQVESLTAGSRDDPLAAVADAGLLPAGPRAPQPADGLLVAGLLLAAAGVTARLARTWRRAPDPGDTTAAGTR